MAEYPGSESVDVGFRSPKDCRVQTDTWFGITVRVRLNPILSNV